MLITTISGIKVTLPVLLNIFGGAAALISALYWYKSSRVTVPAPVTLLDSVTSPTDPYFSESKKVAGYNKTAAAWSALAAVCAAVANGAAASS